MSDNLRSNNSTMALKVFENVVVGLGGIVLCGMIVFGAVFFYDCPKQPMLSIAMIVQGGLTLTLLVLYLLKLRLKGSCADTMFYTIFIICVILCIGWLIAFTSWLTDVARTCPGVVLQKAGVGFCVVLWLFTGVSPIVLLTWWCCTRKIKFCLPVGTQRNRQTTAPRDGGAQSHDSQSYTTLHLPEHRHAPPYATVHGPELSLADSNQQNQ